MQCVREKVELEKANIIIVSANALLEGSNKESATLIQSAGESVTCFLRTHKKKERSGFQEHHLSCIPGKLQCDKLLLAIGPDASEGRGNYADKLDASLQSCLQEAEKDGAKVLAFSSMGHEDMLGVTAKRQVEFVARFLQNMETSFTVIRFVSNNSAITTAFEEAMTQLSEENENREAVQPCT
eukprot:Seg1866.8 transcript_id=Seg1866.8/GoldUCD/mRNA.D3Y31 product="hypothetical protein" protein_id=Seg1866.8/GoldUCD/D3Y31